MTGTVVNGTIIPDCETPLPEGVKVRFEFAIDDLPPDHPMAPFDRDREIAIVLESVAAVRRGEPGIPVRQAFEELSLKHGLRPMSAE